MKSNVIVLNRMFSGGYLEEGNLGHEVINIYKSDSGNNYIYLTKSGKISDEYRGRIESVLLVRGIGHGQLEIIGKTDGMLEEIYGNVDQAQYIKENDIRYGGVLLSDIFGENKSHQEICITFKAERVLKPLNPIFIQYGESPSSRESEAITLFAKQAKQSLRHHLPEENEHDFGVLSEIINNELLWGDEVGYVNSDDTEEELPHTLFDICGITHYELAHSKAIGNLLRSDREFADIFVKKLLGIDEGIVGDYSVAMETEHRIDIFITDERKSIIIENKIKSGINGVAVDKNSGAIETQLDRYYNAVQGKSEVKPIYGYLLSPDYNVIAPNNPNYEEIFYSNLHDIMINYPAYKFDTNFTIITDAFKRHTLTYDNKLYAEMKKLFLGRLKNLNRF